MNSSTTNPVRTRNARFLSIRSLNRAIAAGLVALFAVGTPATASANVGSKVDSAISRIKQIQRKVNVIPNDPEIRQLFDRLDPRVVAQLLDILGDAKDTLDLVQAQREGLDAYRDGGGAERMRNDLLFVLEDLKRLADAAEQIRCFNDPETPLVPMKDRFLVDAVRKMPAAALFVTQKVLDEAMPDWRTTLSEVLVDLPVENVSQLCGLPVDAPEMFEITRCEVLRDLDPNRLRKLGARSRRKAKRIEIANSLFKGEIVIGVAAVAVGGGGGPVSVPNYLKSIITIEKLAFERIAKLTDRLAKERSECVAQDERMERDPLSCTALGRTTRTSRRSATWRFAASTPWT